MKTELSEFNKLKFYHDKKTSRLYYSHFKYKVLTKISGLSRYRLWRLHHENLDRMITLKPPNLKCPIVKKKLRIVNNIIEFQNTHNDKTKCRHRIEDNSYSIYTNDLNIIEEYLDIINSPTLKDETHDEVHTVLGYYAEQHPLYNSEVLIRSNSKYRYRVMLKTNHNLFRNLKKDLLDTFNSNPNISTSLSFMKYLNDKKRGYIWNQPYIDFNDESFLTILCIKFNTIIGKVYTIEKR